MSRLSCALIPLAAALLMTGCQSSEAFNTSLRRATNDISHGRLDQARSSLDEAGTLASGDGERQKVHDLNAVVDGAEAMIDGDASAAAAAWSSVEDAGLRRQLRREAGAMGLDLDSQPRTSNNQEDTR
ncbi:MAG: hypothetical protein MK116_10905 [Phycisphaerales bacterium]|nr:hypothetical protein [Phycisphaerales bacterium]